MNRFIIPPLLDIQISGIRQFNQLASKYNNVIRLTLGEPDLAVPEPIKNAAIEAISEDKIRYTANRGLPELCSKVAKHLNKKMGTKWVSDNVIITSGVAQALQVLFTSITDKDTHFLILSPAYPGYEPLIHLLQGSVSFVDALYNVQANKLEEAVHKKTKAILITSPNNPTGKVYSKEEMDILFEFAEKHDLLLIWDSIYFDLIYTDSFYYPINEQFLKRSIILGGFSKSYAMTGFRLGYIASATELSEQFLKTQQYSITCASTVAQYAGLKALDIDPAPFRRIFKERRDTLTNALDNLNIPYISPDGAFYLFVDISQSGYNSYDFAVKLLEEVQLAVIPGRYFGPNYDHFIRISYAVNLDILEKALERFKKFWKK